MTGLFNTAAKHLLRQPRPFWIEPTLTPAGTSGYGMPSEHVQTIAVLLFFLAGRLRENWVWVVATFLTFLMALSHVYLGVHFVHDIFAALLFALIVLIGYVIWNQEGSWRLHRFLLGQRLLIALAVPVALGMLYVGALYFLGEPTPQPAWRDLALAAETDSMLSIASSLGGLLGVGVGLTLERSRVGFRSDGKMVRRLLRYVVGAASIGLLYIGLTFTFSAIAGDEVLWLAVPLRFVRDLILGLWITYYAPMLFVFLSLADFSAEPELAYTLREQILPTIHKD